ncbi:MAG: tetratricopeptide repeat protein [Planctomycetota bacterium]|jgi:tetratricopeptide (TPR) repeat protein
MALLEDAAANLESYLVCYQLGQTLVERGDYQRAREVFDRVVELAPLADREILNALRASRSEVAYLCGDLAQAADLAAAVEHSLFHVTVAARLRDEQRPATRRALPVGFVRQHHMTCAPATLSAVAAYWSQPVDHLELAEAICYDGTSNYSERQWARDRGWVSREFTVTFESTKALIDRGVPFTLTTVHPGSAHLQAVIGYDQKLGSLLLRDPFNRRFGELLDEALLKQCRATGPRGHALVPAAEGGCLDGLELPDSDLYDRYHELQHALAEHRRRDAATIQAELSAAAPNHRLTCFAALSIARYDSNPVLGLESVERLLTLVPEDPVLLLLKLQYLDELGRRAERWEIYERVTASADCPGVFRQHYGREIAADHSQVGCAERMLERALTSGADVGESLYMMATICCQRLDDAWGLELFRLAACVDDKNEQFVQTYFAACRHARLEDEALRMLEQRFEMFGARSSRPAISLSWALDQVDRTVESMQALDAGISRRPDDGLLMLHAARVMGNVGEVRRAEELLARAENRSPRQAWLRTAAQLAFRGGQFEQALSYWREVLAIEPLAVDAHGQVATLLADTGGRDAAIRYLENALERFPHFQPLHHALLEWLPRDDADAVEEVIRRLIAGDPSDAWAWRELVCHLASHRRHDEAFEALAEAERLDPNCVAYWTIRGDLCARSGRFEDARSAYRRALEIDVDNPPAVAGLLALAEDRAERRSMLDDVGSRLQQHLVDGSAVHVFAGHASETVDDAELIRRLEGLHDTHPQVWSTWSALADALVDANRLDDALSVAAEAVDRFPFIPRLAFDLSRVQRARGNTQGEIVALERALRVNPDYTPVVCELASVLNRLGEIQQARRTLERGVRHRPQEAGLRIALAEQYHKLGDDERARRELHAALEHDPHQHEAWELLMALTAEDPDANRRMIDLARRLAKARAGSVECLLTLARVLRDEAHRAERLDVIESCERLDPHHVETKLFKASVLAEAGRYDEALAVCETPIRQSVPVAFRVRAARIEAQRGNLPRGLERMQQLLSEEPHHYEAWSCVADWSEQMGDVETARSAAEQMMRLMPQHAPSLVYLADVLIKIGELDQARALLTRALALQPDYEYAGFALFRIMAQAEEWDDATRLIDQLGLHFRCASLLAARIEIAVGRNDQDAALAWLWELCRATEPDAGQALSAGVELFLDANWVTPLEVTLRTALDKKHARPEVAFWWVRVAAPRLKFRRACRAASRFKDPYLRHALRAVLASAADMRPERALVKRFVRQAHDELHQDHELFTQVAAVYLAIGAHANAARWIRAWRDRVGMSPADYAHIVMTEFFVGDEAGATQAAEVALQLPHDDALPWLELWHGLLEALAGDSTTGRAVLARTNRDTIGPYLEAVAGLLDVLCRVETVEPVTLRREVGALRARYPALRFEPELRRAYRRTVSRAAAAQGSKVAMVWKWMLLAWVTLAPAG